MSDSSGSSQATPESGRGDVVRSWLLMRMNRWLFTAVILVSSVLVLVAISRLDLAPLRDVVRERNGFDMLFSGFIGAIITGTSIVVTINQLVLSQELGALGDQRDRMQDAMSFEEDVEDVLDVGTSPPEPAEFLRALVDGIETRSDRLEQLVANEGDEELKQEVRELVENIEDEARPVKRALTDAQFGTFDVLWNALGFNYSWKIYRARQIRHEYADALSDGTDEALEDLKESLAFFGPAREHFKTLYFQWALIDLSRALLYIAVPALLVMATMIIYVDATTLPGTTLGVDNLVWLTSVGVAVGLAPFVVFIAYILRIATIAKRTLAMGPFILRASRRQRSAE